MITMVLIFGLALFAYYIWKGAMLPRSPDRFTGDVRFEWNEANGGFIARNAAVESWQPTSDLRYHVFTDRLGARVAARGDQTPDRVDILVIGCSFTWGLNIESEDTYSAQLGQILQVATVNLGVNGYSSIQALQMLRQNLALRPKVVIYGFITDHLRRNLAPCLTGVPFCLPVAYFEESAASGPMVHAPRLDLFPPQDVRRFGEDVLLRDGQSATERVLAAKWALWFDLSRYAMTRDVAYDQSPSAISAAIRFAVGRMAEATRAINAELIVLYMPDYQSGDPPPRTNCYRQFKKIPSPWLT